jgi:hypothetical protein
MSKHVVREGDVFALPLHEAASALCRVAFVSEYFKEVMLITIHGFAAQDDDPVEKARTPVRAKFYCSKASLQRGVWRHLASTPVTKEDSELSRRLVGGDVWVGDQHLGPPSQTTGNLPQMDVFGDRVLIKRVASVLGA